MGTNPTKPVIYWGLFASPYIVTSEDFKGSPRHYEAMGVTSFSQVGRTKMAHGHSIGDTHKRSIHRKVEGMRFYSTREALDDAMIQAKDHDYLSVGVLREAERQYAKVRKNIRLAHEGILNKREIQPRELED